jgi:hypothetical protein
MRPEDGDEIRAAIGAAGFFATYQRDADGGVRLVPVSHRIEGRLRGNSFWVSLKGGRWCLGTWAPALYLVPPEVDLAALCLDCLRASGSPIVEVPSEIVGRYRLVEVPDEGG